jgi:hypothetical protein
MAVLPSNEQYLNKSLLLAVGYSEPPEILCVLLRKHYQLDTQGPPLQHDAY